MVLNHGVLCWWLVIMVCYAEVVLVNHGVLSLTIGCESWNVMLSQWLCIMASYSEPVIVNHDEL